MHMQQHCNSGEHCDVLRAKERELNRNTLAEPEEKKVQPIIIQCKLLLPCSPEKLWQAAKRTTAKPM